MEKITVAINKPSIKYSILKNIAATFNPVVINFAKKKTKENTPIQNSYKTNFFTYWAKPFTQKYINGLQTFILNENSDKCLVYFHGGAYISGPAPQHFTFLKTLAKNSGYKIYFVIYPHLPNYNCEECFNLLTGWFKEIPESEIALGGDSSGGGLATALCKYLTDNNLKVVNKLFTISPWLDVLLENKKIKDFENNDKILIKTNLRFFGTNWVGLLDNKNHMHSPKYITDINKNIPQLIISGSHEILSPDIEEYCNNNKNANITWYEFDKMQHVFILYPCREAKNAVDKVINFLKNDKIN